MELQPRHGGLPLFVGLLHGLDGREVLSGDRQPHIGGCLFQFSDPIGALGEQRDQRLPAPAELLGQRGGFVFRACGGVVVIGGLENEVVRVLIRPGEVRVHSGQRRRLSRRARGLVRQDRFRVRELLRRHRRRTQAHAVLRDEGDLLIACHLADHLERHAERLEGRFARHPRRLHRARQARERLGRFAGQGVQFEHRFAELFGVTDGVFEEAGDFHEAVADAQLPEHRPSKPAQRRFRVAGGRLQTVERAARGRDAARGQAGQFRLGLGYAARELIL